MTEYSRNKPSVPMDGVGMALYDTHPDELPVRALIADANALFRVGLRRTLSASGIAIAGEASNGHDAIRLTAELRPDVVVTDTDLPGVGGVEVTRRICERVGAPPILILAASRSTDVLDALLAGATGVLFKDSDVSRLAAGIRGAAAGETTLAPEIAGSLVDRLRELEALRRPTTHSTTVPLTGREREVLRLVADGRDNSAIGRELYISSSTVKHHVAAILDKLGATNRAQAAAEAVRCGLVF